MTNTIWILGTIERALKRASAEGLTVQSMRLNPVDFKALSASMTKLVETTALNQLSGLLFISDDGISVGYTRLECVKLPSGPAAIEAFLANQAAREPCCSQCGATLGACCCYSG